MTTLEWSEGADVVRATFCEIGDGDTVWTLEYPGYRLHQVVDADRADELMREYGSWCECFGGRRGSA